MYASLAVGDVLLRSGGRWLSPESISQCCSCCWCHSGCTLLHAWDYGWSIHYMTATNISQEYGDWLGTSVYKLPDQLQVLTWELISQVATLDTLHVCSLKINSLLWHLQFILSAEICCTITSSVGWKHDNTVAPVVILSLFASNDTYIVHVPCLILCYTSHPHCCIGCQQSIGYEC